MGEFTIQDIRGAVARGWCHELNGHKVMGPDLAEAISQEIAAALLERQAQWPSDDECRMVLAKLPLSAAHTPIEMVRAALQSVAPVPASAVTVAWMRPSEDGFDSAFRDADTVARCPEGSWVADGWIPLYAAPHPKMQP